MRAFAETLSTIADGLARGDRRTAVLAFFVVLAFYVLTAAGNLSETDDAYAFAYRAEHSDLTEVSDPRLMLYHMGARVLYVGLNQIGVPASGLHILRAISAVSAALCLVLLCRVLATHFRLPPKTAVLATAILGATYGYWRYAVEADVYISSLLLVLIVFHLLLTADGMSRLALRQVLWPALIAGLAVLYYQPNVVPLFFAFPLLFLRKDRLHWLAIYGAVGGAVIVLGYVTGFLADRGGPVSPDALSAFLSQRSEEFAIAPLSPRVVLVSVVKAAFAFSHDLLSASWLFGWDGVVEWVRRVYPSNVIQEEIFTAGRAGWLVYVPVLTLPLAAGLAAAIVYMGGNRNFAVLKDRRMMVCLVWLSVYAAMVGRLNPAGIEAWIMALMPLIILLAVLVVEPCLRTPRGPVLVGTFLLLVLAHNWFGGMALVQNADDEYDLVKGSWVIREAGENDVVIVTENVGLAETLRYRSRATITVIRANQAAKVAKSFLRGDWRSEHVFTIGRGFRRHTLWNLVERAQANGGRIVLFEEFFRPPVWTMQVLANERVLGQMRDRLHVVHTDERFGDTLVADLND